MSIEFIEKVHDRVCMERGRADHDVVLIVCPMCRVSPAQLLPLHPRKGQLLKLGGEDDEGNADHGHHEEL